MTEMPTARDYAQATNEVLDGKPAIDLGQTLRMGLTINGLLAEETQTKPCRTCGVSRPDFTFWKVTPAGKLLASLAKDTPQ